MFPPTIFSSLSLTHTHTSSHLCYCVISHCHVLFPDDKDEAFVKFLLPNFVSGMIIGSAGSTVSRLMENSHTIIKFSPGRELYPGTADRVCIVTGSISDIVEAVRMIFATMSQSAKSDELQESLRRFKMIVSNIASGMVIGKSGHTIKSIQMECGVKIQISNKVENSLPERILTVDGETEAILSALRKILVHTSEDPDASKWKRLLTYSNFNSMSSSSTSSSSHPLTSSTKSSQGMMSALSQSPYAAHTAAMNSSDPTAAFMALFAQQQQQQQQQQQHAYSAYAAHGAASANSPSQFNQALLSYAYAQSLVNNSSYYSQFQPVMVDGVNLTVPGATVSTYEIAIPEVMVHSIAGTDNKLLTDLMRTTGARVQMSGKGEFIPGTYNRKLTVTGPILSVQSAHMIVLQKLLKEQENYQKHSM